MIELTLPYPPSVNHYKIPGTYVNEVEIFMMNYSNLHNCKDGPKLIEKMHVEYKKLKKIPPKKMKEIVDEFKEYLKIRVN